MALEISSILLEPLLFLVTSAEKTIARMSDIPEPMKGIIRSNSKLDTKYLL